MNDTFDKIWVGLKDIPALFKGNTGAVTTHPLAPVDVKIIRKKTNEYEIALKRINTLIEMNDHSGPNKGTDDFDELSTLLSHITAHEKTNFPI